MTPIRTFVVEHQPLMRDGIRMLLVTSADFDAVGEAGSGEIALQTFARCAPDVVLLDLDVPGEDALGVIRRIGEAPGGAKVLGATAWDDPALHRESLLAGAQGIITKDKPGEVVLTAIRAVHGGALWFERQLLEAPLRRSPPGAGPRARTRALTRREHEVIFLLGEGHRNAEIAVRLRIARKTVRNHLASIFGKLGVSDRVALLVVASRRGLVTLGVHGSSGSRLASRTAVAAPGVLAARAGPGNPTLPPRRPVTSLGADPFQGH